MSAIKIDKKIAKYRVEKPATAEEKSAAAAAAGAVVNHEPAGEMTRQGPPEPSSHGISPT